jgi:hypothetical protein
VKSCFQISLSAGSDWSNAPITAKRFLTDLEELIIHCGVLAVLLSDDGLEVDITRV